MLLHARSTPTRARSIVTHAAGSSALERLRPLHRNPRNTRLAHTAPTGYYWLSATQTIPRRFTRFFFRRFDSFVLVPTQPHDDDDGDPKREVSLTTVSLGRYDTFLVQQVDVSNNIVKLYCYFEIFDFYYCSRLKVALFRPRICEQCNERARPV